MHSNTAPEDISTARSTHEFEEYSRILEQFKLDIKQDGYYLLVGELQPVQGWMLNISVGRFQIANLINTVVPLLLKEEVPFKIVANSDLALYMLEGNLGLQLLGKVMEIYPRDDQHADNLAKELIEITRQFDGPDIPTCAHLAGCIYTRYGAIAGIAGTNDAGSAVACIYDRYGQLIADPVKAPFEIMDGVHWPYNIELRLKAAESSVLNGKYKIVNIINNRAKGYLAYAKYKSGIFSEKACIIKQGKRKMFADSMGRDVQDRLRWQFAIYDILKGKVPVPQVLDFFEVNQDLYLVMEFIQGVTLDQHIARIYNGTAWAELAETKKVQLIECLLEVIGIVKAYHGLGLIHRDLSPSNLMVSKNGKIHLIDLELTYSLSKNYPDPPFALGTSGFISPEQWESKSPTVKEDIYGLGALMILFFTGLSPVKFTLAPVGELNANYLNLLSDDKIANLIYSCLSEDAGSRPSLNEMENLLRDYRERVGKERTANQQINGAAGVRELKALLTKSLAGLTIPPVVNDNGFWISRTKEIGASNINVLKGTTIYRGFHTGIGGVLYTIALAKEIGFSTEETESLFKRNLTVLLHSFKHSRRGPGFFENDTSLALIIDKAITCGLIPEDTEYLEVIDESLSAIPTALGMRSGIAGYCYVIMHLSGMRKKKHEGELFKGIQFIIESQATNGEWPGLSDSDGFLGIVYMLLKYCETYKDAAAKKAITKALEWLAGKIQLMTTSSLKDFSLEYGIPGVAMVFIKAYESFNDKVWKDYAIECLSHLPRYPVINSYCLGTGLSSIGMVYLKAAAVFEESSFHKQADWIFYLLNSTFRHRDENHGIWITNDTDVVTADLFDGTSGVIYFLSNYYQYKTLIAK
ncbi:lanthionine synthetase LanC family protein [Chitinophaga sp. GbtcB8]|uniref:class III lanthionine synthetase LanKC N-terminal domain-containing protein n=1 Tax=Chitinophaga sp. GbtcB8 TaxID=2824753 RepID=UPI001C30C38F|nr:lanthionine synthetase LanC family protein [Chitinophaga sp. GbtcB8]